MTIRLRFAPSPTGPLHLGGARTALYNWAAARALGGKFLLRIEDTDVARSTDESLRIILEGLRWLGLEWDEGPEVDGAYGPYFQSQRLDTYARYAERLLASGHAYECFATAEEVEEGRQRLVAAGQRPMYDRRDRDLSDAQRAAYRAEGRVPSLRFRMPLESSRRIEDLCKGSVEVQLAELDDWVLVRADGMPTYNFACVVDDHEMRITHVVRGEEHLLNGFKQLVLFEALGLDAPRFAHIPLILGKDGRKLSKREAVTNILEYRDAGFLPDAIFNYIALLGWSFSGDQDVFSREQMVERFRIEDIHSAGAKFDEDKLRWMAGDYMRRTPVARLAEIARPWLAPVLPADAFDVAHRGLLENSIACYRERISLLGELPQKIAFVYADSIELDDDAQKKLTKQPEAKQWLRDYADLLEQSDLPPSYPADRAQADAAVRLPSAAPDAADTASAATATDPAPCATPSQLEADCRAFADRHGIKFGNLVHPVRAALSGTTKGAGLFDLVFLLGKQRAVERLRRFGA